MEEEEILGTTDMNKLLLNTNDIRNGYINAGMVPPPKESFRQDEIFVVANENNLDIVAEDGTLKEIVFSPPINSLSPSIVVEFISNCYKKLSKEGVLKLWIIDIRTVGLALYNGLLDLEQAHQLIFGKHYELKNLMDIGVIVAACKHIGFSIDSIAPNAYFATVEVKK